MPSKSKAQAKAMQAALSGKGKKKGIPKKVAKEYVVADALRGKGRYGNDMYDYGNSTKGGIHVTHWKPRKSYGGSNAGGASIGGGSAG